jgi:polysaccharide export outer membrane protein
MALPRAERVTAWFRRLDPQSEIQMKLPFGFLVVALLLLGMPFAPQTILAQTSRDSIEGESLLRPGDVIKLTVWREPDWSGEFPIDESGVATLPRLGAIKVTGLSPDSLRHFVANSLGVFLRNPSIEITLLRRIQVLGAVNKPGLYPVPPTITVADVVALAGGATSEGKSDQVILRRGGRDVRIKFDKGTRLSDTPIRTGDQLYVPQRSWISRNTGIFAAGISAATTLIVALLVR